MKTNDLFVSPTSDRVVSISADQSCKVSYFECEIEKKKRFYLI